MIKLFNDYRGELEDQDYDDTFAFEWQFGMFLDTAEDFMRNEYRSYMRLEHVWGSTVPWFYGAFMVLILSL